MPLRYENFGGMIPRLHHEVLPANAASVAHGCDLRGGVIRPLRLDGGFDALHDGTNLLAGIPTADVIRIDEPSAPTVLNRAMIAQPGEWLFIVAYDWVSYTDGTDWVAVLTRWQQIPFIDIEYTERGFTVTGLLFQYLYSFAPGYIYQVHGPMYQFQLAADPTRLYGGPEKNVFLPEYYAIGDPEFSRQPIPLLNGKSEIYGHFQCADVQGPSWTAINGGEWTPDAVTITARFPSSFYQAVKFHIDLNYAVPNRRFFHYIMAYETTPPTRDETGSEGPPSDPSARLMIRPGEQLTLSTPRNGYHGIRLYRSTTGGDDFQLLDHYEANSYIDDLEFTQPEAIPPYGNYPGAEEDNDNGDTVNRDLFLRGSFQHPSLFGVGFHGKTLYLSDLLRFHAWPQENEVPFQDAIKGIALAGQTILVFAEGKVYGVSGGNPELMSKFEISTTAPLLNPLGLCRIGGTVFWPTTDGLAACSGGDVRIITENIFTRREWQWFSPETMTAQVHDGRILLTTSGDFPTVNTGSDLEATEKKARSFGPNPASNAEVVNLAFDIQGGITMTTYLGDPAATGATATWGGRQEWHEQPVRYEFVRISADAYPVTLRAYVDTTLRGTVTVNNNKAVRLVDASNNWLVHGRAWRFEIETTAGPVRRIEVFERQTVTVGDTVRITPENTPLMRAAWLKFIDRGRFCAASLSCDQNSAIPVTFYPGTAPSHTETVTSGTAFSLPRTLPQADGWRVDVDTDSHVNELLLWTRQRVAVGNTLDLVHPGSGGLAPWLAQSYDLGDTMVQGLVVHARSKVQMRLFYDGSVAPSETVEVGDRTQVLIDERCRSLEFDFSGYDHLVQRVTVQTGESRNVNGIIHLNGDNILVRGLRFHFEDRGTWAAISVGSTHYPVTATLTAGGTQVWNDTIDDEYVVILPRDLPEERSWTLDVTSAGTIWDVALYPRRAVAVQGPHVEERRRRGSVAPWIGAVYDFGEEPHQLRSMVVDSDTAVKARVYFGEDEAPRYTVDVVPGIEHAFDDGTPVARRVEIDGNGSDYLIHSIGLYGEDLTEVGPEGVFRKNRPNWRRLRFRRGDDTRWRLLEVEKQGTIYYTISGDGTQFGNGTVPDDGLIRVPWGAAEAQIIEVDLYPAAATGRIDSLRVRPEYATESNGVVSVRPTGEIPGWLYGRWHFGQTMLARSARVITPTYPARLWLRNRDGNVVGSVAITDGNPVRIPEPFNNVRIRDVAIEVTDNAGTPIDTAVERLDLWMQPVETLGGSVFAAGNPVSARGLRWNWQEPVQPAAIRVSATAYPVTLTLRTPHATGTSVWSGTASNEGFVAVPMTVAAAREWEIDADCAGEILDIQVAGRVERRVATEYLWSRTPHAPAQWLWERLVFNEDRGLSSVRVKSDTYPLTLRLYADGATTPTKTVTIAGDYEHYVGMERARTVDARFVNTSGTPMDAEVTAFDAWMEIAHDVGPTAPPTRMNATGRWRCHTWHSEDGCCPAVVVLNASSYVKAKVIFREIGGSTVLTARPKNGSPIQMQGADDGPNNERSWRMDIEVTNGTQIYGIDIYWWRRERSDSVVRMVRRDGEVPPWWYTEYQWGGAVRMGAVRVNADTAIEVKAHPVDGGSAEMAYPPVNGDAAFTGTALSAVWRFEAAKDIRRLTVWTLEHIAVKGQGISVRRVNEDDTWANKELEFPEAGRFTVARIVAAQYPQTLQLADAEAITVSDGEDFRLPSADRARQWRFNITPGTGVEEVFLAGERAEQWRPGAVWKRENDRESWMDLRVRAEFTFAVSGLRVLATEYPVRVRVWRRDESGVEITVMVAVAVDGRWMPLPRAGVSNEYVVDVLAGGNTIQEIALR